MEYFYNGEWYSYEYLHDNYGITYNPTVPITLYDVNLNIYNGWKSDTEIWVVQDNKWYPIEESPYYIKNNSDKYSLYKIENIIELNCYDDYSNRLYEYNNHLYSYEDLHNNFGLTLTPSTIWSIADGKIWSWYNPDENLYWDENYKYWTSIPPVYIPTSNLDINSVASLNSIGSVGLFYYNEPGDLKSYGSEILGTYLIPISLNLSNDGNFKVAKYSEVLTGNWKLMTVARHRTDTDPCIVMAVKVSDDTITQTNNTVCS